MQLNWCAVYTDIFSFAFLTRSSPLLYLITGPRSGVVGGHYRGRYPPNLGHFCAGRVELSLKVLFPTRIYASKYVNLLHTGQLHQIRTAIVPVACCDR